MPKYLTLEDAIGRTPLVRLQRLPGAEMEARGNVILANLPVKPKRIILNTTTVHPDRSIFTVHSIGFAFVPYRIQKYDELISDLVESGYVRRDAWRNEGKLIRVPFIEGGDKAYYAGCCFDKPGWA